ncbi:hypothetical protein ACQEVF_34215 [Nonomuraea polychroma]|uniref:hypothetical protein n=1 Tax=Nonomuraea polychroma TaxID=46176 RepID=UPI003D8A87E6
MSFCAHAVSGGRRHLADLHPLDPVCRPFSLSVVAIDNGFLTELAQFGPGLFPLFHLPATLDPSAYTPE